MPNCSTRLLYRRVSTSVGVPSLQTCVHVWTRPLALSSAPPGSDLGGAALALGPTLGPLSRCPWTLRRPWVGEELMDLCLQPGQQPSLLVASGVLPEPVRPRGQTGREGAHFLTERELVNGRQAGSEGRHPRTTAGALAQEASVGVSGGRLHRGSEGA